MIHPAVCRYAELVKREYPLESPMEEIADKVIKVLKDALYEPEEIDNVTWEFMSQAINDPLIDALNFNHVYEEGWEDEEYLRQIIKELIRPVPTKKLEDYL